MDTTTLNPRFLLIILGALAAGFLLKNEYLFLIAALIILFIFLIHRKKRDDGELRRMLYPGF